MLDSLRVLADQRRASDEAWRSAVIKACESNSMRAVAEAAGVTVGRVHQIVKAART